MGFKVRTVEIILSTIVFLTIMIGLNINDISFYKHLVVSAFLMIGCISCGLSLKHAIILVFSIGCFKEMIDPIFTNTDLIADALGIAVITAATSSEKISYL